ncbi:unnamed protein product [Cochlearia groenlandica]
MTIISDLSNDLIGEILSRVPLISLRSLRSTCKTWNALSKIQIIGNKASRKQFMEFMIVDNRLCSIRFDFQRIHDGDEDDDNNNATFVEPVKQVSILDQVEIFRLFHCDGLLLCVTKDDLDLVVWNPYLGQTRWIQPTTTRNEFNMVDIYAFGYGIENNNRNHKILMAYTNYEGEKRKYIDMYDFGSNTWKNLDVSLYSIIFSYIDSLSLKGNTYFLGQQEVSIMDGELVGVKKIEDYLICFDFTTERFGPHMLLPIQSYPRSFDVKSLAWVRDEKLAVLYNTFETLEMIHIWITTKIGPSEVSWSKFLTLDTTTLVWGLPVD